MSLIGAIRNRHTKDIVVPECNMGSAWKGCRRLDAWVLRTTWSPWTTVGYEIKASRGDFLRDDKWHDYRPVCHEFYFVCTWKLIQPEELPESVGLLWVNKGGKCVTKRKALRRDPDPEKLSRLMSYVLMSRAVIKRSRDGVFENLPREERAARWAEWLEERNEFSAVGRKVTAKLRQMTDDLEHRNLALETENKRWQALARKMREIGLDPDNCSQWNIESRVNELKGVVPTSLTSELRRTAARATEVADKLDAMREGQ